MKSQSKASAPILEIIISTAVFAFAGVFILNMFLTARYTQMAAYDKTEGTNIARSAVETVMARVEKDGAKSENTVSFYDKEWKSCDEKDGVYKLSIEYGTENNLVKGKAEMVRLSPYPFVKNDYSQLFFSEFSHFVIE